MQATSHVLPLAIEKNSRYQIFPELIFAIAKIKQLSFCKIFFAHISANTQSHTSQQRIKKKKGTTINSKIARANQPKTIFDVHQGP